MILDAQTQLSNSQTPTQGTTTVTTNALDLGDVTPKRRVGDGEPIGIAFFIEARTASADAFSFEAISATNDALTGTPTRLALRGPFTAAQIPAGTVVFVDVPPGTPLQRFLGGRYTLGASDALTVSAFVVPRSFVQKLQNYATAIVIT